MIWPNKKLTIFLIIVLLLLPVSYYLIKKLTHQKNYNFDKVTIAAYHGDSAALIYLAKQEGLFRKNKIEITIKNYKAGKFAVDDLISDQVELATATESVLVSNSFKNRDLRILAVISEGRVNRLIARKDHGINKIEDLREKRVALMRKSTGEYYLGRFLYLHNLEFSDIKIVDASPSEIVSKLIAGEVDAAFSWDPNIYKIKKEMPNNTVSWSAQVHKPFYFLLITKSQWINEHPDYAIKICKALVEAEQIIDRNENKLASILKNNFNYSQDYLKHVLGKHQYYVHLSQGLLVELEEQALWRIKNNLMENKRMPDYLDFIYSYALEVIDPLRVSVIR